MDIDGFFMFIEVVNSGSITGTAARLHISQSALSQQIRALEARHNCTLLQRSNRGVTTTPAGELFYQGAQTIVKDYEAMTRRLEEQRLREKVFQIYSSPVFYTYALPCALFHTKKLFSTVRIEAAAVTSAEAAQRIAGGQGDIGFVVGPPEQGGLSKKMIFSDQVFLVESGVSPPRQVAPAQLKELPLVMLSDTHSSRRLLDRALDRAGVPAGELNVACSFDSTETIKQAAVNGYGLAFLPYCAMKKELYNKQLRIVKLEDFSFCYEFYLIRKKKLRYSDPQLQHLSAYFERSLESTIC